MELQTPGTIRQVQKVLLSKAGYCWSSWWRRRELNPRPRKPIVRSLRVYPVLKFRRTPYKTGKSESRLVRLISAHGSGPKPDAYPAK
jgi:hypothetical protein